MFWKISIVIQVYVIFDIFGCTYLKMAKVGNRVIGLELNM